MEDFLTRFALSEPQVLVLLESLVGRSLTGFTLSPSPLETTQEDDKALVDFRCLLPDGKAIEKTVFAKKCVWKNKSEAVHYRYLAAEGVPTPRLYGAVQNAAGGKSSSWSL